MADVQGSEITSTAAPAKITDNNLPGLFPDQRYSAADAVFKNSLLSVITTNTIPVEGDDVAVRVPYMPDEPEVSFVKEGAEIPHAEHEFSETVIRTAKIAILQNISWEAIRAAVPPGSGTLNLANINNSQAYQLLIKNCVNGLITKANWALLNNTDDLAPAGILKTEGIQQAGQLDPANLDAISDALTMIEGEYGKPSHILMNPADWGKIRKTKANGAGGQLLLGSAVDATPSTLFGVQIVVNPAMPKGNILALDRSTVLSSYGELSVTASEHAAFKHDSVLTRMTWRFGAKVMNPKRLALVTVAE